MKNENPLCFKEPFAHKKKPMVLRHLHRLDLVD
jgi:hypothetical protein